MLVQYGKKMRICSKYKVIVTFNEGELNKDGNMAGSLTH